MDAICHTQLIAPALYGNPHNKYSFVICLSYGGFLSYLSREQLTETSGGNI
jgi:hypothetical protein